MDVESGRMNIPHTVGALLRAERTGAGLTQSQLSERCGIPKPTLSRYENDHVLPSLPTLRKLAAALNVTETALIPCPEQPAVRLYAALKRRGVEITSADEADEIAGLVAQLKSVDHVHFA
jgi:transcriptional regulator with XRE-family HTH domain